MSSMDPTTTGDKSMIDGSDPAQVEHLCERDLQVHPGKVEDCCADRWRDEGVSP